MRVVIALGGNALLRRGQPLTAENQRCNTKRAAEALAAVIRAGHEVIISHGNGPQVGLLALQGATYAPDQLYPLDILGAETEGMIGYLIEQELENVLGQDHKVATLLTQVEVDPRDPAFVQPTKPVGPVYSEAAAKTLAVQRGWSIAPDGDKYRRVVASPLPINIPDIGVIRLLVDSGVVVICAGGGGIPVVRKADGTLTGIEAVIDKDRASALLAEQLAADALLLLTDVDGVYRNWRMPSQELLDKATPQTLKEMDFAAGSMAPKVAAACQFAEGGSRFAAIGSMTDALEMLEHRAGTHISADPVAPL